MMSCCSQCRHDNPPAAKFCANCGAKLDVPCPACGHGNAPGARFCTECGEALGPAAPPARAAPEAYTPRHLAERILSSRAALEGERKHVTVLLADLKGSMELLADRDPEEARRLLDPVLEHMMEAVHHYEGTVNQVMGDGIMALFGAPLSHEDHALRACHAALRMQARVGRYGDLVQRTQGVPVQIRIGLNSGEVVVRSIGSDLHMDYSAVGQTTHLAARMEQMAKPGCTMLTPATLRLVEGWVTVKSLGPVPIKGLTEPLEVFELLGTTAGQTRLRVAAGRGLTRFVGRDVELEQLRVLVERARAGHGQVVALVGEPGVGKSRLIWELVRSHRTDGWLVLQASAVAYGKASPFLPVVEILKAYLGVEDRDDVRRAREKLIGKVLTLDESLRPAIAGLQHLLDGPVEDAAWQGLGVDQRRRRALDAVKRVLLRESRAQPLLLVVEDLHWADTDSQALLANLVESLPSHPILLVVNYRPDYRHEWGSKTYYSQIRLDPLPPETAEALLEALLGADAGLGPLRSLLIDRTQGNPFFLEESVRALAESGVLGGQRGAYRLTGSIQNIQVPPTVQAILAARIDHLGPSDKALLQSASVVGTDVPLAVLEAVADLPESDLLRGLERLQSAEFLYETRLAPDTEYTFKHALTHEVAYGSLLHDRRRGLHARVVDAIERLYPDALAEHRDRLLHHAFRGEVWDRAVTYLRDTSEITSEAEIGEMMGIGPESPGYLWWTGEHHRAIKAAERDIAVAASFGNFAMRIVSSCRLGYARHALGEYARAADVLRQTAASLQGDLAHERFGMAGLPAVFSRSYLAWCLAERGEFDEGVAAGEQGVRIAESADHLYSRAHIAFGLGTLSVIRGVPEEAIAVLERGLVGARMANVPFLFPFLLAPLGAAYTLAGAPDRAVPLLEQAVEQAAAMKLRANHALRLAWLARACLLQGRRGPAADHARHALDVATECSERGQQAYAHLVLAELAASGDAPDTSAAEAAYGQALELAAALEMRPLAALCRLGLGALHARAGHPDRARPLLDDAARTIEALGMRSWLAEARRASG
ncbi:MAG: AAA family ATPase [Candidatus Rokubacteria bacterium]|nr:AAA family ATPase [Candidatus Rokubacteria bacterium]